MVLFLAWFINPYHVGHPVLFWLLTFALGFRFLRMLHEWYHYYSIGVPKQPVPSRQFTVDVFTTACPGEPHAMIIATLEGIQKMKYPHTTYLCDEGNDPVLKEACERLGVRHVTRTEKVDAKAGNINNALRQATGEICLILDPDHVPHPDFLDRVVPHFQNPEIGFVQVVQAYKNRKESIIAYGAAEQTYTFYGPMMMSMNQYGTAQAIGANCTFRRAALDSIGGHAPGLAEDMHTAMCLHAKGWKSVYVPEVLSKGLVPATLPSFYKQQLKWSRGTFELLFTTFFPLFKKFTWKQRLHYFTLPLYYLYGLVTFIDILIPVLAICLAVFPWNIHLLEFFLFFTPLFLTSLLIRQYSQRWLLEKHEKGFHVIGGILRTGTWWIYVLGFFYTIFRKKIPYIPTPKDDKPRNNFLLSLPNFLVCVFSLGAIVYSRYVYGSNAFMHPYNLLMVGFVLVNVVMMGTVVIIGQERFMASVINFFRSKAIEHPSLKLVKKRYARTHQRITGFFRNSPVIISVAIVILFGTILFVRNTSSYEIMAQVPVEVRNKKPFFTGIYLPEWKGKNIDQLVDQYEKHLNTPISLVSFYQAWGPQSLHQFPERQIRQVYAEGAIPMITWEPWTNLFPQFEGDSAMQHNRKVMQAITEGKFDPYLQAYAEKLAGLEKPVFLRFAHEPDNPHYPWSATGGNTPEEYVEAWRYVVELFREEDAENVIWVWNPWEEVTMMEFYPGGDYVDWLGFTVLNYGNAAPDELWHSFATLYEPFRYKMASSEEISIMKKPVMIAEFGSTSYGGSQIDWTSEALYDIQNLYPEIYALVFFYSDKDNNWATDWRPSPSTQYIDWTFPDTADLWPVREKLQQAPYSNKPVKLDLKSVKKP
ncbi:glycosyltransferase family 2 protein [Nafulsella turpanensis]|uniref:glycosyltransferase family 2 protein n=1 Tax=Nafulsella turpanensis TaxID=1265690 RepID=UPI00034D7397|nr:glycosyltransferase [Nafulsella turpanensis]